MSVSVIKSKLAIWQAWYVALVLVLIPFHAFFTVWLGSKFGYYSAFRLWKEYLLVLFSLSALLIAYKDKQLKTWLLHSPLAWLIWLYALLQILLGVYALLAGHVNASAYLYALVINLRFLAFFIIALVAAFKVSWLNQNWQKYIIWPAVIVVSFGLTQHFLLPTNFLNHFGYGPKTIPAYQAVDLKPDYIRAQSTLRGPNPLGAYLVLIMTVTAGLWLRCKNKWFVVLFIEAAVVMFFTYSRSAWLGLVLSLALLGYLLVSSQRYRRLILISLAVLALVLGSITLALRHNNLLENTLFHTDQSSTSAESSNAVRTQAMLQGAKSVIHQPLGEGPGTAGPASVHNNHPPRIAENYYIQIAQETGVTGLALFILINIYLVMMLYRQRADRLSAILLASLVGISIVNVLSHAWTDDSLAYLWWGLAGIALAPSVIMNKERKPNGQTKKEIKTRSIKNN